MSRSKPSLTRPFASLPQVLRLKSPYRGVDGFDQLESSQLEPLLPADPDTRRGTLPDLLLYLQELLPAGCERLGRGAVQVIGQFPASAGGTADVWEGKIDDRRIAMKSYRRHLFSDCLLTYARFYKEALTVSHLRHQNVVKFIGTYATPEHSLALVFDFADNLDLGQYLKNNGNAGRLALLSDIAHGVEYIHKKDVVHGGIRMENILVDSDGRARVGGLGTACISEFMPEVDVDEFFETHGSAPELVYSRRSGSGNAKATKESDIHELGALAYEMFAGNAPVFEEGKFAGIHTEFYLPSRPEHPELSDRVWRVLKGCLKKVPSQRKTIGEVVAALDAELGSG